MDFGFKIIIAITTMALIITTDTLFIVIITLALLIAILVIIIIAYKHIAQIKNFENFVKNFK